jgi:hypothetical protein
MQRHHVADPPLQLVYSRTLKLINFGIKLVVVVERKRHIRRTDDRDGRGGKHIRGRTTTTTTSLDFNEISSRSSSLTNFRQWQWRKATSTIMVPFTVNTAFRQLMLLLLLLLLLLLNLFQSRLVVVVDDFVTGCVYNTKFSTWWSSALYPVIVLSLVVTLMNLMPKEQRIFMA